MINIPIVILARGGSKGIVRKNVQRMAGQSLIARAVSIARLSDFNPVYVYSDSEEILDVARSEGANAVERPIEVSGDTTTSEETMQAFIETIDPHKKLKAIVLQQCTTPFLATSDLNLAYEKFNSGSYDSIVSATLFVRFLGYRSSNIPGTQDPSEFVPLVPYRQLRQSTNPMYMENGGIYLATRELWMAGRRIGQRCGVVLMDWWRSLEVDDPIDLEVARKIAPLLLSEEFNADSKSEDESRTESANQA